MLRACGRTSRLWTTCFKKAKRCEEMQKYRCEGDRAIGSWQSGGSVVGRSLHTARHLTITLPKHQWEFQDPKMEVLDHVWSEPELLHCVTMHDYTFCIQLRSPMLSQDFPTQHQRNQRMTSQRRDARVRIVIHIGTVSWSQEIQSRFVW